MTLFETLFYYYTLFGQKKEYSNNAKRHRKSVEGYLQSLQHSVDSSVNVKKRFKEVAKDRGFYYKKYSP